MMKTKNMLWMSALLALLAGCSQGELGTDDAPGKGVGKEIRLVFSGGGESQEYTRAIASESENQIDNLDIYVFAATADGGDYQYLETWKAAAQDDTAAKTFKLSRNRPQGLHLPDGAEGYPQPETVLRGQQHHALQSRRRPDRPSGSSENQRRHRSHRNRRHESHGL